MELLGTRLRNERKRLGLTQLAFAKIAGVEPNAQSHYEKGLRLPKADYLQRVCDAGVDLLYLFNAGERDAGKAGPGLSSVAFAQRRREAYREVNKPVDAGLILDDLFQSLSYTTQVIEDVATWFQPAYGESPGASFASQVTEFRKDSQRFIDRALMHIASSSSSP